MGLNYYFYPAVVLKFAYEINTEIGPLKLNDNLFMAQFVGGSEPGEVRRYPNDLSGRRDGHGKDSIEGWSL